MKRPLRVASILIGYVSAWLAQLWSDPYRWIPEAARLLRPGGEIIFLGNSAILMLCEPEAGEAPAEPTGESLGGQRGRVVLGRLRVSLRRHDTDASERTDSASSDSETG